MGFVWKRKNVTLTGHGAMARLDRTVRTLRKYMEDAFFGLRRKEQGRVTWYLVFQMAVERFNKVPHTFSDWEPEHLVRDPWEMHQTRLRDYKRGWKNYRSLNPYFRIKKRLERLPKGRRREWRYPDPQDMVYAEVDNTDFNKRYKYTTFAKSQDRRMFRAVPRRIAFLYGNKFLLKDDNYRYPLPHQEDELIPGTTNPVQGTL